MAYRAVATPVLVVRSRDLVDSRVWYRTEEAEDLLSLRFDRFLSGRYTAGICPTVRRHRFWRAVCLALRTDYARVA